jgi:altronate dehydratase small subunit
MQGRAKTIVIDEKDNVAVALKNLNSGSTVGVNINGHAETLKLMNDIPKGHKFALIDIEEGGAVIKYGEQIGKSTRNIARGEHVHVHNIASQPKGGV